MALASRYLGAIVREDRDMRETFKDLPIGADFRFLNTDQELGPHSFLDGPWRKVGARKYAIRIGNEIIPTKHHHAVSSINVLVQREG